MSEGLSMFRSQVLNMVTMWNVCPLGSAHTLLMKEWIYEWKNEVMNENGGL